MNEYVFFGVFMCILIYVFIIRETPSHRRWRRKVRERRAARKEIRKRMKKTASSSDWAKVISVCVIIAALIIIIPGFFSHFPYISNTKKICLEQYEGNLKDFTYLLPQGNIFLNPSKQNSLIKCSYEIENKTFEKELLIKPQ